MNLDLRLLLSLGYYSSVYIFGDNFGLLIHYLVVVCN